MKYAFYSLLICGSVLTACGHNNAENDGESVDTGNNAAMTDTAMGNTGTSMGNDQPSAGNYSNTPLAETEKAFVMKAASGGMMEVELGNMAQQKAQSQRVKDFGAMMVRDHGKSNSELMSIATAKGTTPPQELMPEHRQHVQMLEGKTGAAFDKAYMQMMVQDHQKDVADFEKTSNTAADTDLKAFAGRTLPVLRMHRDSAQAINKSKM